MARHRGQYKPENTNPYELSRGKVETFVRCPACFWLDRAKGVHFPGMPGFNLNTNTDTLLKRDFDQYRGKAPHPFMVANGLGHLVPFEHEHLSLWETSLHFGLSPNHFNTVHEPTNILFGGGLDDVWINPETNELHIVDYKSTANLSKEPKPVSLEGQWKEGYKRQMDMYQWIMRRKGFTVSDIGYFVYVDGQHVGYNRMIDDDTEMATMKFKTSLLTYEGNDSWIEPSLFKIKDLLESKECPEHVEKCEHERFLSEANEALRGSSNVI